MRERSVEEMTRDVVWTETTTTIESKDWTGNAVKLEDIPALENSKSGRKRILLDDIIKAKQNLLAKEHNLENPRQVLILMSLYAPVPNFKSSYVENKYKFNKMLFFLRKKLENEGLGDSFVMDEFVSGRSGPIPIHLRDDLKTLESMTLLEVSWGNRPGESTMCSLTRKGMRISKKLWNKAPEQLRKAVQEVKIEFFPLTPGSIRKKVLRECPEYHKMYTELDEE